MNISPEPLEPERPDDLRVLWLFLCLSPCKVKEVLCMSEAKRYETEKKKVINNGMTHIEYEKAIKEMCKKRKL